MVFNVASQHRMLIILNQTITSRYDYAILMYLKLMVTNVSLNALDQRLILRIIASLQEYYHTNHYSSYSFSDKGVFFLRIRGSIGNVRIQYNYIRFILAYCQDPCVCFLRRVISLFLLRIIFVFALLIHVRKSVRRNGRYQEHYKFQ